jgi:hypothetical protein
LLTFQGENASLAKGPQRSGRGTGIYTKPSGHQSRRGAGDEAAVLSDRVEGNLLQGHPHQWPQLAPQGAVRGRHDDRDVVGPIGGSARA